jgi:hypothetical protein
MAPDLVRATARYWSRFSGGRYVEPLETIRSTVKFPGALPADQHAPDLSHEVEG